MLPRSLRLTTKELEVMMEKGRVAHSALFLVRYTKVEGKTRIAAIVPKKIGKTAATRNSGRRKIYNAIAPIIPSLKDGLHIVLFAKASALKEDANLPVDLKEVFVKSGLMK